MSRQHVRQNEDREDATRRAQMVMAAACAVVFLVALGVRLLHWQDNPTPPFHGMTGEYKAHAMLLVEGDLRGFLRGADPPSDANVIKHPPGYPVLMAAVYKLFGTSDDALRLVHILFDAASALLVLVIAYELLPFGAALVAGMLVALSPQLAYHSVALLPDPLATPPLLVALYLLIRAHKRQRLLTVVAVGVCVGVSCWIRSNAMLLPFFFAALVPILFARGKRVRYAAALVASTLVLIAPITIRNLVFFKSFIPLSLSAGITMVEGIGIYDEEGRFGLPSSDYGVTKWEAQEFNRPDYLGTRFSPDGVERERHRIARGVRVIRENPFWFAKVMIHRGLSMLRLARVENVAAQPAVTHAPVVTGETKPVLTLSPFDLGINRDGSPRATNAPTLNVEGQALHIEAGAASDLLISQPLTVRKKTDYLLRLPLKIERGSVRVEVIDADNGDVLASTPVLHPVNWLELKPGEQPSVAIERSFVSGDAGRVRVVLRNGSRKPSPVVAEAGALELFDLGPASGAWTRYPRIILRGLQNLFLTALMLPLALIGAFLMWRAGRWRALALLLVVPAYYVCVQSALWTEFRYVLAMYYPLFVLPSVTLQSGGAQLWRVMRRVKTTTVANSSTLCP